jgi:hypothetical protein
MNHNFKDILKATDLECESVLDFLLISDGSGYDNVKDPDARKYLGYYTIVYDILADKEYAVFGSEAIYKFTSVYRAEFLGLLSGLACAFEMSVQTSNLNILWICDNKSLVNAVNSDAKRNSCLMLWDQFKFFEKLCNIKAIHLPRKTDDAHNTCDINSTI